MTTQVSGHHKKGITIYDIAVTALFAALCYVATYFLRIEIPTPLGRMMIHGGNIVCLLSALLMGPLRGAAADAIGMGLFDLLMAVLPGDILGPLKGGQGPLGQLIHIHDIPLLPWNRLRYGPSIERSHGKIMNRV